MTVGEFAQRTGLTRQRIYQLMDKAKISIQYKQIDVVDISESELTRFLSVERPKGRPPKK